MWKTMYIKQIILDGFKSYGKKVVVDGFDPAFTAITGFNGTGKSNILDSICFVLGISNLSQVIWKVSSINIHSKSILLGWDSASIMITVFQFYSSSLFIWGGVLYCYPFDYWALWGEIKPYNRCVLVILSFPFLMSIQLFSGSFFWKHYLYDIFF